MTITLKRLWNNLASIRDYLVDQAINRNEPIIVKVNGVKGKMTLTPEKLKHKQFQVNQHDFNSRFNKRKYTLIDFSWQPDDERQMELL